MTFAEFNIILVFVSYFQKYKKYCQNEESFQINYQNFLTKNCMSIVNQFIFLTIMYAIFQQILMLIFRK